MVTEQVSCPTAEIKLHFDLGTFEGFNFRNQSAIEKILTAEEAVNWEHDKDGEAEFWPSGDHVEVAFFFHDQSSVSCSELQALDALLQELGGDDVENFLKLYHALKAGGASLFNVTASEVEDYNISLFFGESFIDLRKEAAYSLFETFWPEAYKAWKSCNCDGLIFDVDRFLDSPSWSVEEITLGDEKVLLICPQ